MAGEKWITHYTPKMKKVYTVSTDYSEYEDESEIMDVICSSLRQVSKSSFIADGVVVETYIPISDIVENKNRERELQRADYLKRVATLPFDKLSKIVETIKDPQ